MGGLSYGPIPDPHVSQYREGGHKVARQDGDLKTPPSHYDQTVTDGATL